MLVIVSALFLSNVSFLYLQFHKSFRLWALGLRRFFKNNLPVTDVQFMLHSTF